MHAGTNYLVMLLTLTALVVVSLFVGVIDMSPRDILTSSEARELVMLSRFPRTIAVVITGSALAICGMIMQMLVRNRFVEPMTTGTGQGAALGILLVTLFIPNATIFVKMICASITALAVSIGFLAIVRRLPATQPLLVPLVGIIYGGLIGAGVTFVAYQGDMLQYIDIWMNGEFAGVIQGRYELLWIAALFGVILYLAADQFSIVGLGQSASINLGLNYKQVVMFGLIAISIVTALTVVTVGMIPFVGLVVPNIISRLRGDNLRNTLPIIALMGAILVLGSDILGRILRFPFEIPVGTIFGVVGVCIFLWLLYVPARHAR